MKQFFYSSIVVFLTILNSIVFAGTEMKSDSVVLSAGYAKEAYYSLSSGTILTSPRATWDIAFRTRKFSSSILINDGSGVVLYTYPKTDTTGWANVDTLGIGLWKPMFNDPTDWENGAFSRYAKGHPDYGWGRYNDITHNLTGDSLFVIKLRDGSYRKLWIVGKKSAADIYTFRFAKLDGTAQNTISLDLNPFISQDFYGYSLQTNEGVSFQPPKTSWDILFTKYMSVQPNGTPYAVVGVLNSDTVSSKKFHPVPLNYNDFGASLWDSTRSSIGWDWKVFDNNTFSYKIVDSTVYFVKQTKGDIYKLYFTAYAGSSTGLVKFNLEKSAGAGIENPVSSSNHISVYPNPATDKININFSNILTGNYTITLTDLSGRQLRADHPGIQANGSSVYSMDVTGVQPGTYFVTVVTAATRTVAKVIITR